MLHFQTLGCMVRTAMNIPAGNLGQITDKAGPNGLTQGWLFSVLGKLERSGRVAHSYNRTVDSV